jgi:rod shape-determining protein MreD
MRILRRALVPPAFLVLAVLAQVTIVNRLPLPGGAAPDLVLLVVAALAVTGGPVPGMLAGFAGGLALDIAPPVSNLSGETALVFCAAGYACGLLALAQQSGMQGPGLPGMSPLLSLPVMAVGAGLAEALRAGLGLMLSDPRMTGPAIARVLPAAIVYDVLFCPLILWLVAAAKGAAEPAGTLLGSSESKPAPARAAVRAGGILAGGKVPRLSFAGDRRLPAQPPAPKAPRLNFAGSRQPPARPPVPALPKLRLSAGAAPSPASLRRTHPGTSSARAPYPGGHPVRVRFDSGSRDGAIGGISGRFAGRYGGGFSGALGPSLFAGKPGRKKSRDWLRSSGGRPLGATANATAAGGAARMLAGRPGKAPGKGWLQPARPAGAVRKAASPGAGWLRGQRTAATMRSGNNASWSPGGPRRGSAPGKGWIRPAKPVPPARRKSPGRGWLKRKPAQVMWQRKSPGRGWLSRGSGRGMSLRGAGHGARALGSSGVSSSGVSSKARIGGRR